MMARHYDTGKHGNECYRPIPVHTPSNRRVPASKPYVASVNSSSSSSETAPPPPSAPLPRYDSEYDYKTTHYPSYPPNYPYEDNKYKYEGGGGGGGGGGVGVGVGVGVGAGQQQPAYANAYNEKPGYAVYEESPAYDSRGGYMAPPHATAVAATPAANPAYPQSDTEYGPRYYGVEGRAAAYPVDNCPEQQYSDKGRYNSYGYEQRCYYEGQADGRYAAPAECRYMEVRYADTRHPDSVRHPSVDPAREADCRYMDGREMDRRYVVDGREHVDGRYAMDNREIDARYATPDSRDAALDGRYVDPTRYPAKENYYDRYYKHRPSRDHHHVADTRY